MYVCIYIFCNVLMDGMEWNGMEGKGRNGIVDRQLDGWIDMIHVKDSYIQKMPLHRKSGAPVLEATTISSRAADARSEVRLSGEGICFICSKILGS